MAIRVLKVLGRSVLSAVRMLHWGLRDPNVIVQNGCTVPN